MKINQIRVSDPFKDLFPIDNKILFSIQNHMEKYGYDYSQPIVLWAPQNIVLDGHTRLIAAKNLGLEDIPVFTIEFETEDEALEYAIHNQRDRRNLTDADIARLVETIDKRKQRGGDRKSEEAKSKTSSQVIDSSAQDTAKIIGTSRDKVEKTRTILDHAGPEVKEEVLKGKKSIHKAYTETQKKRKKKWLPPSGRKPVLDVPESFRKAYEIFEKEILIAKKNKWISINKAVILEYLNTLINICN